MNIKKIKANYKAKQEQIASYIRRGAHRVDLYALLGISINDVHNTIYGSGVLIIAMKDKKTIISVSENTFVVRENKDSSMFAKPKQLSSQKQKCYFFVIEERNGEQEYSHRLVTQLSARVTNVAKHLDNYLRGWYEDGERRKLEDGGYYFMGGTVHAQIDRWKEISAMDYSVLKNYL